MKPHLSGLILLTWLGWACIVVAGDRPNIFWITGEDNGQYLACYGDPVARTNVLQVQGEAIVRNNLLMAAQGSGFASTDHQGRTVHLAFVHNTIISRRRGANLSSWNDRNGMMFSNNVVYTDRGDALRFPRGAKGVIVSGNVLRGRVSGVAEGFITGNGLTDFADVSWDGNKRDATPSPDCPFIGQADTRYAAEVDITGIKRSGRPTAGAFDAP